MRTIATLFTIALAFSCFLASAQTAPLKQWDKRFGSENDDVLNSLQQTSDGGYILGGYSSYGGSSGDKTQASKGGDDYWIVKTNSLGNKEWDKVIGGSGTDQLYSLQQTTDGGYILGGASLSGISGDKTQASQGDYDYWIVKTDSLGNKQWDKTFGGSAIDFLYAIQQTTDGGYILGGYSYSGKSGDKTQESWGAYDFWIVKTDASGNKQWDKRFGGSAYDYFSSLKQTIDKGYILGGYTAGPIDGDITVHLEGLSDYWIVKIDSNGNKQWDNAFGGNVDDILTSLTQTTDGGYLLGGSTLSDIGDDITEATRGSWDYWMVKTDGAGTKEWDKRFGGNKADHLTSFRQTIDEGYILGGYSESDISGDKTEADQMEWNPSWDYWMVKTDASGSKQWDKRFGGEDQDYLTSIQLTAEGGYILGGYSESGISGNRSEASRGGSDYWIVNTCGGLTDENCTCPLTSGLTVVKITGTSAKLKWNNDIEAELYKVRYKVTGTTGWTHKTTDHSAKPISNLIPNTNYTWQVKTYCTTAPNFMSEWTAEQNFTTGSLRMGEESPAQLSLHIYPNPVEDVATIQFTLVQSDHLKVSINDVSGKEIKLLLNDQLQAGKHSLSFTTSEFLKGVYVVKMISAAGMDNKRLVVE